MRVRALVLTLLLAWLVIGCSGGASLAPLPADAVILAFGDSLTEGTGGEEGYPVVLERLSGRRVVNAGIRGEESDAGLARLPGLLAEVQPDLVILGHGGNDILRGRDLGRTEAHLRRMVELTKAQGADVVLLGVPKKGLFLGVHPLYERLSESLDVPLEADALSAILRDPALKSDAVHPNTAGYRQLAAEIHALLHESGAL